MGGRAVRSAVLGGATVRLSCFSVSITTSRYPLPSICVRDPVSDWFESLAQCLHWNVRKKQAHFAEDEEDAHEEDGAGNQACGPAVCTRDGRT